MPTHTFSFTDSLSSAVATNEFVLVDVIGAGSLATNRDGVLITSNAAAAKCSGLGGAATTVLATTDYLKTTDGLDMTVKIKTPASLTAIEYLIGFVKETLDAAAVPGTKDAQGEYNNTKNTAGLWFWFDKAVQDYWCVGYRDAFAHIDVAKYALAAHTVGVSTEYTLRIQTDTVGFPTFSIDGTVVHSASVALDAAAVIPVVYVIGNAKTLYVREISVGKTFT